LGALRGLAQAIAAQAILAIERHRQARDFFGTPAGTCQAAGEFRSAPGTGEAARGLNF
jgi:isochorismate synthase EntC